LVSSARLQRIELKRSRIQYWIQRLEKERSEGRTWAEQIRRDAAAASRHEELGKEAVAVRDEVLYRVRYQGYLVREERQVEKLARTDNIRIPHSFNYLNIKGLRKESALKLSDMRPMTLGQASRISGVNPADISVLMVSIETGRGAAAG
jgi:tRNA uridine 5-carboxymethylaminomethyl modification enzyme